MSTLFIAGGIAAVAVSVAAGYIINRSAIREIESISQSDESLVEVARPDDSGFKDAIRDTDDWAQSNGFNPYKLLQMQAGKETVHIASWQDKKNSRTLLLRHVGKKNIHEIITRFGDDEHEITLSTSNDKETHALPSPPGFFAQNFNYGNLDMLLGEHIPSESYVEKKFSLHRRDLSGNIRDEIFDKLSSQCAYVKSLGMWKFKGPYWRLIRRQLRANAPVKTLY